MEKIGIITNEEAFYEIFLDKWKEYLHRIKSGKHLQEIIGCDLKTVDDVKRYMEEIKVYIRGHNLYDIFYGKYKEHESELLQQYIRLAPKEDFADILESVNRFIYFENRRKGTK